MKVISKNEIDKLTNRRQELFDAWADDPKHKDYKEFCRLTTILTWLEGLK